MTPTYLEPERFRASPDAEKSEAYELRLKIESMAEDLVMTLEDPDPQNGILADGLVVCTFVDINNLYRTSSFGRYVAGQLMNELQRYSYQVIDMRKNLSVVVQEKRGEFGLSRNPDEIPSSHEAGAMLTGTYLVGEREIIVNAGIVDNRRGELLSSATVIFPRNALGNLMLQDTATAKKQSAGVIYMKKLEM
ncbi:MAG: FlgO family outer membrane protein [Desulfobulbaceae bacterium]|nr:FlgO family outer membrane protein [Desulfobulbaceae bacterium]